MVACNTPVRAPGFVRVLGLLVVVFGILAMHTGIAPGETHPTGATTAVPVMAMRPTPQHGSGGGPSGHPMGAHGAGHACVFILSAAVLVSGLVLVSWGGAPEAGNWQTVAWYPRAHRARPPPWTTPSLAELSILRI